MPFMLEDEVDWSDSSLSPGAPRSFDNDYIMPDRSGGPSSTADAESASVNTATYIPSAADDDHDPLFNADTPQESVESGTLEVTSHLNTAHIAQVSFTGRKAFQTRHLLSLI